MNTHCLCFHRKNSTSFEEHAELVVRLLVSQEGTWLTPYYIFGTCYQKMTARFEHRFSRGVLGCLLKIRDDNVLDTLPNTQPPHTSDTDFYKSALFALRNLTPSDELKTIICLLDTATVNLSRAVFHKLLCILLMEFRFALIMIGRARAVRKMRNMVVDFAISAAVNLGIALRMMIYSNAMEHHLEAIASYLTDPRASDTPQVSRVNKDIAGSGCQGWGFLMRWYVAPVEVKKSTKESSADTEEKDEEAEGAEEDRAKLEGENEGLNEESEYESILPSPLAGASAHRQLYSGWLWLIIAYVEAPFVIRKYLQGHRNTRNTIEFSIPVIEYQGTEMTPWAKLLERHGYPNTAAFEAALTSVLGRPDKDPNNKPAVVVTSEHRAAHS